MIPDKQAVYWIERIKMSPHREVFVLVSCAVAPGSGYKDFELAQKEDLMTLFPQEKEIIHRLCR